MTQSRRNNLLTGVSKSQRWIVWAISTLLIMAVSLMPSSTFRGAPTFPHADKLVHFLMYGVHAALLLWALDLQHNNVAMSLIRAIFYCAAYGIFMECLQATLLPNDRLFSVGDIIANIAGALCFSSVLCCSRKDRNGCNEPNRISDHGTHRMTRK